MKKFGFYSLIIAFLFLAFSFSNAKAQMPPPPDGESPDGRPNLLQALNLSPEQIQQIRRLNQERRPALQEARRRLDEANRALDQAIYADVENESEIQNRMKDVQAAQAEMVKNRTLMERAIRRILTPQQLARFRELREQFKPKNKPPDETNNRRQRLKNLPKNFPRRQPPPNQPD